MRRRHALVRYAVKARWACRVPGRRPVTTLAHQSTIARNIRITGSAFLMAASFLTSFPALPGEPNSDPRAGWRKPGRSDQKSPAAAAMQRVTRITTTALGP
jgi:hypothetical protein